MKISTNELCRIVYFQLCSTRTSVSPAPFPARLEVRVSQIWEAVATAAVPGGLALFAYSERPHRGAGCPGLLSLLPTQLQITSPADQSNPGPPPKHP